jgi:hypothetical protein
MAVRLKVVSVGEVTKEKTYFVFPITIEQDGKTHEKKLFSFNGDVYTVFKNAKPGEQYDVGLEKDKNGYWQWKNPVKVEGAAVAAGTNNTNSRGFETPEERARRQVLIVRQSCLAQAVIVKGTGEQNADNITELAEQFEAWVLRD